MALTHPLFTGSVRISEAYENRGRGPLAMSPTEDRDATRRLQKALLIVEGPRDMASHFPNGVDKEPNGIFGAAQAKVVIGFQQRVFPGQVKQHHGRVGRGTLDSLEVELRNKELRPPLMLDDLPKDTFVFITGAKEATQLGKTLFAKDVGEEGEAFSKVSRPGRRTRFIGFAGTLVDESANSNIELALEAIVREFDPTGKLILYGYSAGAVQLLQLCERIDLRNVSRKAAGQPLIMVDLLVTNDAAAKEKTPAIRRVVAGSVRKNVNPFQLFGVELDSTSPISHGGPNTATPSKADGSICIIQDVNMTVEAAKQAALRQTSPHGVMQQLGHEVAMRAVREAMAASPPTPPTPPTKSTAMLRGVMAMRRI